jgi:catechol 2,3-dioxygenase-like lactoylglutathione lyase family enzyme
LFKRIDHVALHVADVGIASEFYVATLGFEQIAHHRGVGGRAIAYLRLGDSVIELTSRPGGEPMSGFHLCLEPDDFDAAFGMLRSQGLALVADARATTPRWPSEAGWRRAVFRGPHGELIEIRGGSAQ